MAHYRDRKVAQEIQRAVNELLQKRINDPRLQDVTITEVRVTGDLQQATIYYSTLKDDKASIKQVEAGLEKAKGLIRKGVGERVRIYKTPELFFERDESVAYGSHIDDLIRKLNQTDR